MEYKNPYLIRAIRSYQDGVLNQQQYYNQLDLMYKGNPTSFTEEEVDFIEKEFKKVDLPFQRDLEVADANLLSTVNQFVSGLVEGFTTLGWAEDPDTTAESIANKVGHLIGFAPDVVASVLSMGQYVPIATAKAISRKGAGAVSKGLQKAGQKAPPILRKEIGTDTFVLQSIPMKVADVVIDNVKASFGRAGVDTTGYLAKGIFKSARFRDIGEQALHLGVAMGVSSWKDGPKAMADTAIHGAMAGALFGTIGNYVNVSKLLSNPKTREAGQKIIRGVAQKAYDTEAQLAGVNMAVKGALGSAFQGGMATAQGLPVPEQIYEYLLGAFFGATARDAGFIQRTRYINKNFAKFGDPAKPVEQVLKELESDKEFSRLSKYDQEYVKGHIDVVQQQIFERNGILEGEAIALIRQIAKENNIDLPTATRKQFEEIKVKAQERNLAKALEDPIIEFVDDIAEPLSVTKIISGMQAGADYAGLLAAEKLNIATGGFVNESFYLNLLGKQGLNPKEVAKKFGLQLTDGFQVEGLRKRTALNVQNSDATILFTGGGSGSNLTFNILKASGKPYLVIQAKNNYTQKEVEQIRTFLIKNKPKVLNIAGSRDSVYQQGIVDVLVKGLDVSKQFKSNIDSNIQDIINDLGLDFETFFSKADQKDLNEPIALNNDIRAMADVLRGYKIGRNKDEIIYDLAKLADESNYEIIEFQKKFTEKYKYQFDTIEALKKIEYNRLGTYLKIKKHFKNRPELLVDLSTDGVKIITAPKVDIDGVPVNNSRPKNKYNDVFGFGDGRRVRLIVRKSYVLDKLKTYGTDNTIETTQAYRTESPLGFDTKPSRDQEFKDYLSKEAIEKMKVGLAQQDAYIFSGAKDSGMILVHKFPFTNAQISTAMQRKVLKDLGLFVNVKLTDAQVKEYTSNIYYLLRESGYLTEGVPLAQSLVEGVKKYVNEPLFETVQAFNKYQNLAQGSDIQQEVKDFVRVLTQHIDSNLRTNTDEFNAIQMKDFLSKFEINGEPSASATDAVVYIRKDVFNAYQQANFRPADNGFLKLVGYTAPRNGVGNILLKTGTFKATEAMNKFMQDNNIHFIVSESATKTKVGLKAHQLDYNATTNTWSSKDSIQPFKIKPEETYLNYGVYENPLKIDNPVLISKQMFDKMNYLQLGSDGPTFRKEYQKLIQDSLAGKTEDNNAFKLAMDNNDGAFQIRDLNSVSLELINEAISKDNIRTDFGKSVLKKLLERGQEDYHSVIQEQGDKLDPEMFGIETLDIPDILAKVDYDIGAITFPPLLRWINRSLANYRQMRLVKPTTEYGAELKLGPADPEVAAGLKDNEVKLGLTLRKKKIFVKDVGEMTLEKAWNIFEPMKTDPAKHQLYNNYKEALTFLIMRNPNSGNGGVRVVEFAGFSNRDGIHIVTTSKTDYYLGGADKDADSVIMYQNMPDIFKKVFKKYEDELVVNNKLKSFEQPDGTWKDLGLVVPYDTTGQKKVSKRSRTALEDLINTDQRINVARNAKIGKVNIDFIVSSFNKMQVMADLIQQEGGVLNAKFTKKVKGKVEEQDVTIKLKTKNFDDVIRSLQLDNYIGVNLMADSANFVKIAKFNQIQDIFFNKYFEISGPGSKLTFQEAMNKIDSFRILKEIHNTAYIGEGQNKYDVVEKVANDYLDRYGALNHYYYELAKGMKDFSNFTINPFNYLFGEKFQSFNTFEVAKAYTLALRQKVLDSKLLQRYGIQDNYRNEIESIASLEKFINDNNYDALHQKMIEYQGMHIALELSKSLEREALKLTNNKYSDNTVRPIVQDIIDYTYQIKRLYDKDQLVSMLGKDKKEMEVADINKLIAQLKAKYKVKFKNETSFYNKIEELIDTWLLSTPIMSKDISNLQQKLIVDIEKQNSTMRSFEKDAKNLDFISEGKYQQSIQYKTNAIRSLQPYTPFMIKSIAINPVNRKKYFEYMSRVLNKNAEIIANKLNESKTENVERFLQEWIVDQDHTFNIKDIEEAAKNNPEIAKNWNIKDGIFNYDYRGIKEPGTVTKTKDTPKFIDKVLNVEKIVGELLPQFDYITNQQNNRNKVIITESQKELKRLRQILTKSPDAINRFEELFIEMTYNLEGLGRRLDTITTDDLKSFNNALEVLYSPKTATEKGREFSRGPNALDNTLNYSVVSKELIKTERLTEELSRPVVDKYGQMKQLRIEVPTSTLELIRQSTDRFDTFQKVMNPLIQDKIDGTFEYLDYNNQNLVDYRDLMFEAAVNKQEYNEGRYPTGSFDKGEREFIKKSWEESKKALDKLDAEGITIPVSTKTGEAIKEQLKPSDFVEKIRKDIDELLKDIDKVFIKSRHQQLAATLIKGYKIPGLSINKDGIVKGQWLGSKTQDPIIRNMEQLFLTESGLIDTKRVSILYKDLSQKNISEREYISKFLPSVNDYRFLKFHLEVKDRIQFLFPKIDLNKPLKGKELKTIQQAVQKELYSRLGKNKEYFKRFQVGEISEGYFPRNSHGSNKAERPLLEEWQKNNVEQKVLAAKNDITKLPPVLQVELKFNRINQETAILLYREQLLSEFERQMGSSLTAGQAKAERQILDIMSRPNVDGFIGDYATGSTKSRSEQFMPYYKKDLDAVRRYTDGLFKMYFTNLAGLRAEILLKNFDYANKGKEFAREWSNYMRNAATNMMGLSTYRAYNIHGIRKQDQPLFKEFIEKGLDIDAMGPRKNYELEALRDFDIAIAVQPSEQVLILSRNKGSIAKAEAEIKALRLTRARRLSNQINTTGKYGSLYHYTSDEVAVRAFDRINKLFGGKIFGELPRNERDRAFAIMSRIRNLSDLEGKFELLSLLSHPKTAITNFYGGIQNTISDTGWKSFRLANDSAWMIKNLFDNGRAEFSFVDKVTGKVEKKQINSQERIYEWLESIGVYDQMFLDLIALDKNFGRQGYKKVFEEFIRRMNKSYSEGRITTETIHNREANKTFKEVIRDSKIDIPITEFGALPMKWSERKLRGTAFLANYINFHQNVLGPKISEGIPFNSQVLVDYAMKGVTASQFMYQATYRPNFANTSLGRVLTRFQPYAWNSIGRRIRLFKDAQQAQWNRDVLASKKFQRQFTFDLFALAMANIFVSSIFEYALSPPMNWLQDTSALLFGDEKERERAFFSSYPHPVLAPLQVVTPPIGRFVLSPVTSILNGDWEKFTQYQLATYFPFGRLYRDAKRTYESPAMAVDFMTGLPLHRLHQMRRDQIEEQKELELQNDLEDINTD